MGDPGRQVINRLIANIGEEITTTYETFLKLPANDYWHEMYAAQREVAEQQTDQATQFKYRFYTLLLNLSNIFEKFDNNDLTAESSMFWVRETLNSVTDPNSDHQWNNPDEAFIEEGDEKMLNGEWMSTEPQEYYSWSDDE